MQRRNDHYLAQPDCARKVLKQLIRQGTPVFICALFVDGAALADRRRIMPIHVSVRSVILATVVRGVPQIYLLPMTAQWASSMLARALGRFKSVVAMDWKPICFALWNREVDIDNPRLYDLRVAAAAASLGHFYWRYYQEHGGSEKVAQERAGDARGHALSMAGLCKAAGIREPMGPVSDAQAWIVNPNGAPPDSVWEWAMSYMRAVSKIYRHQLSAYRWIRTSLADTEFAFVIPNAFTEWIGVGIDARIYRRFHATMWRAQKRHKSQLNRMGLDAYDADDVRQHLCAEGFSLPPNEPLTDKLLYKLAETSKTAAAVFGYRQAQRWTGTNWAEIAINNRLFPVHEQLKAQTGRSSCSNPAVTNLPRKNRNLVAARPGYVFVGVDYGAADLLALALLAGDEKLYQDCVSGDIYSRVAKVLFADELSKVQLLFEDKEFKKKCKKFRNHAKTLFIALLYNMGLASLARKLHISQVRAGELKQRLFEQYPNARAALERFEHDGLRRGYAQILGGLRRHGTKAPAQWWVRNFYRNTPVQGAVAVIFKRAVIRLFAMLRRTGAAIVLLIHDGVLLEVSKELAQKIGSMASTCFVEAFQDFFPHANPRVDVTFYGSRWNEAGAEVEADDDDQ